MDSRHPSDYVFEALRLHKKFLHFNDNSRMPDRSCPNYDKLFKVRPLIDAVNDRCKLIQPEESHSVDEQIIPTKGRSSIRQYLPKNRESGNKGIHTMWYFRNLVCV
jgi:hypothetical protein